MEYIEDHFEKERHKLLIKKRIEDGFFQIGWRVVNANRIYLFKREMLDDNDMWSAESLEHYDSRFDWPKEYLGSRRIVKIHRYDLKISFASPKGGP